MVSQIYNLFESCVGLQVGGHEMACNLGSTENCLIKTLLGPNAIGQVIWKLSLKESFIHFRVDCYFSFLAPLDFEEHHCFFKKHFKWLGLQNLKCKFSTELFCTNI